MPVYDYNCKKCGGQKRDVYKPLTTSPAPMHCGQLMERLVTTGARPDPDRLGRLLSFMWDR